MSKTNWHEEYRAQLLNVCKYYNGEQKCPFSPKENDNRCMLWHGERAFVFGMESFNRAVIQGQLLSYHFHIASKLDAVGYQVQRNAVLFNMYSKSSPSTADAVDGFVKLMQEYYK